MFADNWKISLRQIKRLLILDLFGLSSLMLPGILSAMTGADGIFSLLLGMAGGFLLLWLLEKNLRSIKQDYYSYMKETAGQLVGDIFMVFYLVYFVTLSGFVLYQTAALVLTWLLPEGSYLWISALLLLVAGYGTIRGIEGRARVYEIIFWFLGIPLLFMLFLSLREVNSDYWTPIIASDIKNVLEGALYTWIFFLPLCSILFLKPFCKKTEKLAGCGRTAIFAVTGMNIVIYLILTGVFGQNTMGVLKRPVITLMSMINLPGGFFTRQDVVMISVWFFALFALLHTGVFQSTLILKELCGGKSQSAGKSGTWSMVVVLILAFFAGKGFFENNFMMEIYDLYQKWIVLPGIVGIPLILWLVCGVKGWWKNRKGGRKNA